MDLGRDASGVDLSRREGGEAVPGIWNEEAKSSEFGRVTGERGGAMWHCGRLTGGGRRAVEEHDGARRRGGLGVLGLGVGGWQSDKEVLFLILKMGKNCWRWPRAKSTYERTRARNAETSRDIDSSSNIAFLRPKNKPFADCLVLPLRECSIAWRRLLFCFFFFDRILLFCSLGGKNELLTPLSSTSPATTVERVTTVNHPFPYSSVHPETRHTSATHGR